MNTRSSMLAGVSALALMIGQGSAAAHGLPGGGHFTDGQGRISRDGGELTVDQDSRTAVIDWRNFSVGKANGVVFDNGHGATLNIVRGGNLSRIAGSLQSSGSVYLINRAGVVIGKSGRVDTQGSFIASGRTADTDSFGHGGRRLHLTGAAKGNVINRGAIASGASVTLYGRATRAGSIAAQSHVETSGEHVRLHGASVSARDWLIDPRNLSVGGQAANAIEISLNAGTDVRLKTTATNASGPGKKSWGDGDITIASRLGWSTAATLTLDSYHSIFVNKPITLSGPGGLVLRTARGGSGDYSFGTGGRVAFTDVVSGDTQGSLRINGADYTLANSIAQLASDIAGDSNGNYALSGNYDAIPDGTYVHTPVATALSGNFEGLGNVISNLTINSSDFDVGLFSSTTGSIRDIGLTNIAISGGGNVGGLIGENNGTVTHSYAAGAITATNAQNAGGLVGRATGTISNSHADVIVAGGAFYAGGLVGYQPGGQIMNSYATGNVSSSSGLRVGGLVGEGGHIENSHASGAVSVGTSPSGDTVYAGGLAGAIRDTLERSYATGNVSGGDQTIAGGLIGRAANSSISRVYATGNVTAGNSIDDGEGDGFRASVGGLIGELGLRSTIENAYATGSVTVGNGNSARGGMAYAGGLIGDEIGSGAKAKSAYATGAVVGGTDSDVGGFIGRLRHTKCTDCYWDMTTSGIGRHHGAGDRLDAAGISGKKTAQFQTSLLPGFGSAIWKLDPAVNGGFPYLKALRNSY